MPQDRKYNMFQDSKRGKDCRSPGRLSDIQPVEKTKFPFECYNYTKRYLVLRRSCWVVCGNRHLEEQAAWHAYAQLELADFPLKQKYHPAQEVNIQNADRVASTSMRQHNCVKDDPSGQFHSTFFACQADVGGGGQGNCLASNLNKSMSLSNHAVVVKQRIGSGE